MDVDIPKLEGFLKDVFTRRALKKFKSREGCLKGMDYSISKYHINIPDWLSYIRYDERANKHFQYTIRRGSSHDGTMIFENELIGQCLENLLLKKSFCKRGKEPDYNTVEYLIGDLTIISLFGIVELPIGKYSGERNIVSLPVICLGQDFSS